MIDTDEFTNVSSDSVGEIVEYIQASLQHKNIIIDDKGEYTSEAHDIERKKQIYDQLKQARKLRAVLENAVSIVKASTTVSITPLTKTQKRQIFHHHRDHINELVPLTLAVIGNYALDSYHRHALPSSQQIEHNHNSSASTEQRHLVQHLKHMAWERDPVLLRNEMQVEEELKSTSTTATATVSLPIGTSGNRKQRNDGTNMTRGFTTLTQRQLPVTELWRRNDRNLNDKIKAASVTPQVIKNGTENVSSPRQLNTPIHDEIFIDGLKDNNDAKFQSKKQQPKIKTKSTKGKTSSITVKKNSSTRKRKSMYIPATRKCHDCKEHKSEYRTCEFWFANGTRCRKSYCSDCLKKYSTEEIDCFDKNGHCPLCIRKEQRQKNKCRPNEHRRTLR